MTARPEGERPAVTDAPALRFDGVSVRYRGRAECALDGVSLVAMPARVTAVVGPNGSGKSSLVRALLRRVPMEHGSIRLGDSDIAGLETREFARRVAVVSQREEPTLSLSIGDFIALGRFAHRPSFGAMSRTDLEAVARARALAGIAPDDARRTDQLSGGEWQLARIARALAQDASVLVLDEPTTFLDVAHEMEVFELLDALALQGTTVLLVSHQLNLVARFSSHMVLLSKGTVAASGSPNEVMRGDVLEQVYRWPLVVTRDPAVGAPALLPLRGRQGRP